MKDKEKMIEEMAKVLHDRIINKTWRAKKVAEELYKIAVPEGAVVLTREELWERDERLTRFETQIAEEKARKETAREILTLWARENRALGENLEYIDEIAYKFGVEVEE